jgi:uncharacterized protein with FMN-binding domain
MKSIVLTLVASAGVTAADTSAAGLPPSIVAAWTHASTLTALPVAARLYADGTYTGAAVDSVWGPVQVQAVVKNGQIVSLKALRYPNDRRESLFISQLSLPRLRDEVVRAQGAKVDVISGATVTSQAFMQSLEGALNQAR